MFDLSWAEFIVISLVSLTVIGPKELPNIIRTIKSFIDKIKKTTSEIVNEISSLDGQNSLKSEVDKINEDIKTIIDLNGNEQPTYDISDLLEENKKDNKIK